MTEKTAKKTIEALSFEEAFGELQVLVEQMEAGNLPLEDTLRLFERGTLLSKHCQNLLDKAELRLKQLTGGAAGDAVLAEPDAD